LAHRAARAIAFALWDSGYALEIANRSVDRARAIANHVARKRSDEIIVSSLETLRSRGLGSSTSQNERLALIVNASTLGMTGQPMLDLSLLNVEREVVVYDIVYTPLFTPLLVEAQARGVPTIDGLQMLVGQAARAFSLFFGHPPPRQYDAELRALLTQ
jgi:shikimate dehydrogenase